VTAQTGLSRYFDLGAGPAPEVVASELDARGRNDYDLIRAYFRTHKIADYDVSQYYDAAHDRLLEAKPAVRLDEADRLRDEGVDGTRPGGRGSRR